MMDVITSLLALLLSIIVKVIALDEVGSSCPSNSRENNMRRGNTHRFHQGPILDHVLRGTVYRNVTARAYVTCAVFCLQEDACKSFNYCKDSKLCQLNSAVYSENKTTLARCSGCLYFDEEFHEELLGKC